jgi:hypothetical protein
MSDAPTRAKGHKPRYFDDPAIDQLHAALLALAAELSVASDRIDTLERLLERSGALQRSDIDSFEPDEAAARERAARRDALVARLLRPFREYREHLIERAGK